MVAKPAGVRTVITGIPSHTGHDASTPRRYFRLGGFTLGNVDGFAPAYPFEYAQQLLYPIPAVWELLAYDIRDGASCLFQELVEVADLTMKQPWDRTPLPIALDSRVTINGNNTGTIGWSYVVPVGRRLMVSKLRASLIRSAAATSMVSAAAYIQLAGSVVSWCELLSNVVGANAVDDLGGSPLIMNAGQTLVATYACSDTGGSIHVQITANGTLFDA